MKGLLIKDFKLLKMQKNFFFMIVVIAIGMAACMHDITFVYGYLMFIVSMFSLSTISYDEFDNGNAFLFTLPISRRGYVIEKYCFGLLLDFGSWILAFVLSIVVNIVNIVNKSNDLLDVLVASAVIFAFMIILQAVMIPLQIKFGAEKSRIAIIAVVGITVVVAFVIAKCFEFFGIDVMNSLNSLSTLSVGVIIAIVVAIAIAAFALSMKISTSIMNRKEF